MLSFALLPVAEPNSEIDISLTTIHHAATHSDCHSAAKALLHNPGLEKVSHKQLPSQQAKVI